MSERVSPALISRYGSQTVLDQRRIATGCLQSIVWSALNGWAVIVMHSVVVCLLSTCSLPADEPPLTFRNDVLPILTKAGCNSGKCHGAASGKDGFGLSLYGFDPAGDYYRITQQMVGRRIDLNNPENCLLVNKALGEVPHTGGALLERGDAGYVQLVRWIAEGAKPDPETLPLPTRIDVEPAKLVMEQPGGTQKMAVLARYSDGSVRDVTNLTVFLSNNDAAAAVTQDGLITGEGAGTAFILARFDQFTAGTEVIVRSGATYPGLDWMPNNYVDQLAADRWRDLHVLPSELSSDRVFLRRIYLDVVGRLPTLEEQSAFFASAGPDRRELLIDQLVDQDAFLDMWIMRLAEMLQIRSANGLSTKGLQLYDRWLRQEVYAGKPINEIVGELISASGSTFENPATSYYQTETTPQLIAENIAQAFLGTRIQCAQCHNHPFDRWTMDDYYGFASFVSQVGYKQARDPREITIYNLGEGTLKHPIAGREVVPKFLGGDYPELQPGDDLRQLLADWLTSAENREFAENIANVLWDHFMGQGIVDPVDDFRMSNPPSNRPLLSALGQRLIGYKYNVKDLVKDICKSKTYQLSTQATEWNRWDERNFSHAKIRRLRAEVLLDCISQVTGTSDTFAGLPLGGRAIEIPNDSSNNYFLETFGRASRDTPCSCEVSTSPTLSQALHLLNGENTTGKIERGGKVSQQLAQGSTPLQVVEWIYLTCLIRPPTGEESRAIASKLAEVEDVEDVEVELNDLFWAIVNANEFIFNH